VIVIELCPAIRASVKASHPASASLVRAVCRKQYGGNGARIGGRSFLLVSSLMAVSAVLSCSRKPIFSNSRVPSDFRVTTCRHEQQQVDRAVQKIDRNWREILTVLATPLLSGRLGF